MGTNVFRPILLCFAITCLSTISAQNNKEWRDSLTVLSKQIEANPKSVNLRLCKAAVNLQLQQWEYAINEYDMILLNDPHNLTALYFRAYANNNLRRYELAKNDYEDFLKLAPSNLDARLGLAYTLIRLDRQTDAINQMNNAVEQHPDSAIAYVARAGLERDMHQYMAALYDWDEAIRLSPSKVDYIASKADILILLNRKTEAKATLDEAVKKGTPRGVLREWYNKCR